MATRHILATPFKTSFFGSKIDRLLELDEDLLLGKGTGMESLRPLAYTMLTDLIHSARAELSLPQLTRVVYIFSRNLHDPSLPVTIQISALRTMTNLVDYIYRIQETQDQRSRNLLVRILWTIANKFETIAAQVPRKIDLLLIKMKKEMAKAAEMKAQAAQAAATAAAQAGSKDEAALAAAAAAAQKYADAAAKEVPCHRHSVPFLLKSTLLLVPPPKSSRRRVIREMKSAPPDDGVRVESGRLVHLELSHRFFKAHPAVPRGGDEYYVPIAREWYEGAESVLARHEYDTDSCSRCTSCCRLDCCCTPSGKPLLESIHIPFNSATEEKDILDSFASLFMVLESRTFRDVFTMKIESVFNHIVADAPKFSLLMVTQQFLSNVPAPAAANAPGGGAAGGNQPAIAPGLTVGVNRLFADILLSFLVKRMPDLAHPLQENHVSSVILQLFRLVFSSVNENESMMRPIHWTDCHRSAEVGRTCAPSAQLLFSAAWSVPLDRWW